MNEVLNDDKYTRSIKKTGNALNQNLMVNSVKQRNINLPRKWHELRNSFRIDELRIILGTSR